MLWPYFCSKIVLIKKVADECYGKGRSGGTIFINPFIVFCDVLLKNVISSVFKF